MLAKRLQKWANFIVNLTNYLISQNFRREEQNFIAQSEAENKVTCSTRREKHTDFTMPVMKPLKAKRSGEKHTITASLVVIALKRLLPVGMNLFGAREQELIQQVKQKLHTVNVCNLLLHLSGKFG